MLSQTKKNPVQTVQGCSRWALVHSEKSPERENNGLFLIDLDHCLGLRLLCISTCWTRHRGPGSTNQGLTPTSSKLSYFGSQASYRTFLLGCLPGQRFRASLVRELWSRWVSPSAPSTSTSPVGRSAPVAGWLLSGTTQGGGTFVKEGTILP